MDIYNTFLEYYPTLVSILIEIDELLPECVFEGVISIHFKEEISAISSTTKKVQRLLDYIGGKLARGYTIEFLILLKIMKRCGSPSTKELANHLYEMLFASSGDVDDNGIYA